ncbi:hypothetical protein [Azospirillum sp. TSO22-1]|uniref:hypothetical protein n=1 Tax=Azospirillum sp. TSO22-1 TaxID=716789 RepID=UPI000D61FEB1|nr:hypothetical protein [Azospirillum sp. TSO22-1]PWC55158.1 hypothetical protein TSO221_05995 [Azospirillum sp. TSO22-1]
MKELRCLVFTDQEVIKATIEHRRKLREALPAGTIRAVAYAVHDGAITTAIRIVDDHGEDQSMTLGQAEVAAALVGYCMERGIPLPVHSDKCLYLINGALTLMITMNFNKTPRFTSKAQPATESAAPMAE